MFYQVLNLLLLLEKYEKPGSQVAQAKVNDVRLIRKYYNEFLDILQTHNSPFADLPHQ